MLVESPKAAGGGGCSWALEFDGPSHFLEGGSLTGRTLLKRETHWACVHAPAFSDCVATFLNTETFSMFRSASVAIGLSGSQVFVCCKNVCSVGNCNARPLSCTGCVSKPLTFDASRAYIQSTTKYANTRARQHHALGVGCRGGVE